MDTSTIIWILVAVVVIGAVIAFVVSRSGARRVEAERAKAAEIREKALEHDRRLRENEASATEADAKAQMARAEAQKQQLEAERLAAEADSRSESAEAVRRERDEQLRLADLRDPDVETDKDGNRLNTRTADAGARNGSLDERTESRVDGRTDSHADGRTDGSRWEDRGTEDGVRDGTGLRDGSEARDGADAWDGRRVDEPGRDAASTAERTDTYEEQGAGGAHTQRRTEAP